MSTISSLEDLVVRARDLRSPDARNDRQDLK